ncbi:hypothetical protein OUZ56_026360 [Daphnia magna]|uniref:Uncharacterized protein n=1 Tax=Daphnia magna TaxID=35525 RepID=A0ABQ9ZLI2_9CRUS|nr:hypothetical protein OUZ56_026360 [Daphnia magna]
MQKFNTEKRIIFALRHKLCFLCLGTQHSSSLCSRRESCGEYGSNLRHHMLLHQTTRSEIALGTVHAEAYNGKSRPIPINILYDECSTDTLIRACLARRLGLTVVEQIRRSCCVHYPRHRITCSAARFKSLNGRGYQPYWVNHSDRH